MNNFRVYLGSPEQSIWPDSDFVFSEKGPAFNALQNFIQRPDLAGKQVFAKLTFNGQCICFHRFDTVPQSTICFISEHNPIGHGQEQAVKFLHAF